MSVELSKDQILEIIEKVTKSDGYELLSKEEQQSRLFGLANSLSVEGSGTKTVLYSGVLDTVNNIKANDVAVDMAKADSNIRIINNTIAGQVMGSEAFATALAKTEGYTHDDWKDSRKNNIQPLLDLQNKVYDPKEGPWAVASKRFVELAQGDVLVLAGIGRDESVFSKTEFPEILKNKNITSVNGYSIDDIKTSFGLHGIDLNTFDGLDPENVNKLRLDTASKYAVADGDISKLIYISNSDVSTGMSDPNAIKRFETLTKSIFEKIDDPDSILRITKGLNKLGVVVGALSALVVSLGAANLYVTGKEEEAKKLMEDWAVDAAGSMVGDAIGAAAGGIVAGVLTVAGVTLSAPVTFFLIISLSVVGGVMGSDAISEFYDNNFKDLDKNGQLDIIDRLANALFGVYTLKDPYPIGTINGALANIDTNISVDELVSKARNSEAWMYALKYLNPFVVEGINYSIHNQNGELDFSSYSDEYLRQRAQMLLWRFEYVKKGLSFTEDYNTIDIEGNWDFIDYVKQLDGNQELRFTIDGKGVSSSDHQIVFANDNGMKILEGSGDSDFLFGGAGSDELVGDDGDDWLEGGKGLDTLEGGKGNDTYYFGADHGSDTITDSGDNDKLLFGKGISKEDLVVKPFNSSDIF